MNGRTVSRIVVLGALTGMRSMAGVATLAAAHRSVAVPVMALAVIAEMIVDKTSLIGDRIDPLPVVGRATLGAVVGALVARQQDREVLIGGLIGAVTAVVATHLAFQARKALPGPSLARGLAEDGLVVAIAARYVRARR